MRLDLAYDKNTGLFRSAIEIPHVVDVRADVCYVINSISSMMF